jgi:hypothetical protein
VKTIQLSSTNKMDGAIIEFSKRFIYFDYFYKVPWIWGGRKTSIIPSKKNPSFVRKYSGFCSMAVLNLLYCGCILSFLLRKLMESEKDQDFSIVGVFVLLLIAFTCMIASSYGCMILLHTNIMGSMLFQLRVTKGTYTNNNSFYRSFKIIR